MDEMLQKNVALTISFFWTPESFVVAVSSSVLACAKAFLFGITSQ